MSYHTLPLYVASCEHKPVCVYCVPHLLVVPHTGQVVGTARLEDHVLHGISMANQPVPVTAAAAAATSEGGQPHLP